MSPLFAAHDPGPHPERPARYGAVERAVAALGARVRPVQAEPAAHEALERVPDPRYVEALERFCRAGGGPIDPDTSVGPQSFEAARTAAGAALTAVEAALRGTA